MKVEINIKDKDIFAKEAVDNNVQLYEGIDGAVSCDVAIDIGQVLAANQALLKNMARKMEMMESKLSTMERVFNEQAARIAADRQTLLHAAVFARFHSRRFCGHLIFLLHVLVLYVTRLGRYVKSH